MGACVCACVSVCRVFSILHCNIFGWTLCLLAAFATYFYFEHKYWTFTLLSFWSLLLHAMYDCTMERRCSSLSTEKYNYFKIFVWHLQVHSIYFSFSTHFKHNLHHLHYLASLANLCNVAKAIDNLTAVIQNASVKFLICKITLLSGVETELLILVEYNFIFWQ